MQPGNGSAQGLLNRGMTVITVNVKPVCCSNRHRIRAETNRSRQCMACELHTQIAKQLQQPINDYAFT